MLYDQRAALPGMPLASLHPAAVYFTGVLEALGGPVVLVGGLSVPTRSTHCRQLNAAVHGRLSLVASPWLQSSEANALNCRMLFWLVVAMTPANINMWMNDVPFGDSKLTYGARGTHYVRAAAQVVLLLWLHLLRCAYDDDASTSSVEMKGR